MDTSTVLPHVNAVLNGISAILITIAFILVKSGKAEQHRKVMIAAVSVSAVFLVSYLIYHFSAPVYVFPGEGWVRPVYFTMLTSHVIFATLATPMIGFTVFRALTGNIEKHRAIARWTFPVWLYTTVTGVLIYLILFQYYGSPNG